jgi:hypothetical protein
MEDGIMLNRKKLVMLILLGLSVMAMQSNVLAQEPTEDWVNKPITQQTGVFTAEFNAKATADSVDAVLGLSNVEPADYPDLNVLIQFNNDGFILVKNGDDYESLSEQTYEADMSFAFKQVVDIPAQTHSLWVTPEGGDEVLLAEDYAFSVATDTLNYRSVKMSMRVWLKSPIL